MVIDKEIVCFEKKYFPQSIAEYAECGGSKPRDLASVVKKHLSCVGWSFYYQTRRGKGGDQKKRELRFVNPNGRVFYTLPSACEWYLDNNGSDSKKRKAGEISDSTPKRPRRVAVEHQIQECLISTEKRVENARPVRECRNRVDSARSESHQGKDSICSVCRYEGDLIVCDQCPSAFHTECVGLKQVPEGGWFCPSCCCRICNQVAGKQDRYLRCSQCEHRYHFNCLRSRDSVDCEAEGICFCSSRCQSIHSALKNLLGKPVPVGDDGLQWVLLKYKHTNISDHASYSKLNSALGIMHECFDPCKEADGRDIVKDAIFNRSSDLHRLNFPGFYTMGLGRNGKFFIAAIIRIHGGEVAEIPFVGTRFKYRKLGMCRILMNVLEKKLVELGVEKLVLPAAEYIANTWENKFGFSRMNKSERLSFIDCNFLDFPDTIMFQKILQNTPSPDYRQDEHIYDHLDEDTMAELFMGVNEQLHTDMPSCEHA